MARGNSHARLPVATSNGVVVEHSNTQSSSCQTARRMHIKAPTLHKDQLSMVMQPHCGREQALCCNSKAGHKVACMMRRINTDCSALSASSSSMKAGSFTSAAKCCAHIICTSCSLQGTEARHSPTPSPGQLSACRVCHLHAQNCVRAGRKLHSCALPGPACCLLAAAVREHTRKKDAGDPGTCRLGHSCLQFQPMPPEQVCTALLM
ncbi:hypothetical protein COO60DRAFT_72909 [Scenedesmus sp. NREL 46B-D3]|nr:hypothetical protein COO60DRAFT_72909 [Scenedesmus sp. NREL 46B-D3]